MLTEEDKQWILEQFRRSENNTATLISNATESFSRDNSSVTEKVTQMNSRLSRLEKQ